MLKASSCSFLSIKEALEMLKASCREAESVLCFSFLSNKETLEWLKACSARVFNQGALCYVLLVTQGALAPLKAEKWLKARSCLTT
jgi:hypothetical protein